MKETIHLVFKAQIAFLLVNMGSSIDDVTLSKGSKKKFSNWVTSFTDNLWDGFYSFLVNNLLWRPLTIQTSDLMAMILYSLSLTNAILDFAEYFRGPVRLTWTFRFVGSLSQQSNNLKKCPSLTLKYRLFMTISVLDIVNQYVLGSLRLTILWKKCVWIYNITD